MHLGYCTNIHSGEDWKEHFSILKENVPSIKKQFSPDQPLGLGLRLANQASIDLENNTDDLKKWLAKEDLYVFTMNGFPYGEFHAGEVKDKVHAPDWTTVERKDYTIRLFKILADIIPGNLSVAGISTSPLSYRYWWKDNVELEQAIHIATQHILDVVEVLIALKKGTGKSLHLDIEPEPDGILENSSEFIHWYQCYLLPLGKERFLEEDIREHVQLCYDVCHFAVGFENHEEIVQKLSDAGIKTGKIQVSSALKVDFRENDVEKIEQLKKFNEPIYLHQVVAQKSDGTFESFRDLGLALTDFEIGKYKEWRIHFHVPLFTESYDLLKSTQFDITDTLRVLKKTHFTEQLEIETYTWGILPEDLQLPLNESIARELAWVKISLENE